MSRPQKNLTAVIVLLAVSLSVFFQVADRGANNGWFIGYWPLRSVFFAIPLMTLALVTVLIGKLKLRAGDGLARLFLVVLGAYAAMACLMMSMIYDFDFPVLLRKFRDLVMIVPMQLGVILPLAFLVRWVFGKMDETE